MRRTVWPRLVLTGVAGLLILLSLAPVSASSANISHSYHNTEAIPNGSILSLDPNRSDYVQLSNTSNATRLLGIAVAEDDSLLAVDPANGFTQVATTGVATTLVSTLNGAIKVGDKVAVSPFNGIGMKAPPAAHVIGLAETGFNDSTQGSVTQTVTDKDGNKKQIKVGFARVTIAIGVNNAVIGVQLNSLQKVVQSITGKTVSTTKILMSLLVVAAALLVSVALIYASIYGSIISVGRNPLAKHAIFRTLGSVFVMVATTALVATVAVVFLLR